MRRPLVVLVLGVVLLPASSRAGNLTLRGGAFFPRADTGSTNPQHFDLFADASELYTRDAGAVGADGRPPGLRASDWTGFTGGIEYNAGLGRRLELGFSVDGYRRTLDTSYRDYTRPGGEEIRQSLYLNIVPVGVSLRILPAGRRKGLRPYVAVGADLIYYDYRTDGDFIDFFDPDQAVFSEAFRSEGVAAGFHVAGGLCVPLGHDFSLVGEFRYQWAEHDMPDDFDENRIDLTGPSATLGLNIRF